MNTHWQIRTLWTNLDDAARLLAENVAGAIDSRSLSKAEAAWSAWLAATPWAQEILRRQVEADTAAAKAASGKSGLDWTRVKAEAARLGYEISPGGLSKGKRGQIARELRALGAAI